MSKVIFSPLVIVIEHNCTHTSEQFHILFLFVFKVKRDLKMFLSHGAGTLREEEGNH